MKILSILSVLFLLGASFKSAGPGVGTKAPEIELTNPEGKTIKLSSLRGKVVLIDFWASWCGPCRKENPNVVEVYNKYNKTKFKNGKGFEVFSVSLDKDEAAWKAAIAKDGLIWKNHVRDGGNVAGNAYGVAYIPSAFLVDGKGTIVAAGENCRGLNLHVELDKLKK